jgi:cellulose synthase/poly-beta-1,6-N-acetylglucosamine synthase-like glycosyltransferase
LLILVVSLILLFHLVINIIFFIGFLHSRKCNKSESDILPTVSVLVAVRNEENNIKTLIQSLKNIDYPPDRFEVIFIDDYSSDNTNKIIKSEINLFSNFKLIQSQEESGTNLKGKANAIDTGIQVSKGDIIFVTDADCLVQKNWIKSTVKYYRSDNIAMVCGFTNNEFGKSVFLNLQSFDWLYLLSIASSSSGLNNILSCIGNNISFRKNIYNFIGGYNNIEFSVTEDLSLLKAIKKLKNKHIIFPLNENGLVFTTPCKNISELYYQKKRWFKGGIGLNFLGYILGIDLYFVNIILLFGWFFLPFLLYVFFILMKMISELIYLFPISKTLRLKNNFLFFPVFQIYFAIYGILLPFSFIFGKKIYWKNRKF